MKSSRLNDLDGKEWVKLTKSVWHNVANVRDYLKVEDALQTGVLFSESLPRDDLKKLHPATFSEDDVSKLVRFFTKENEVVLDPFMGVGSSGVASVRENRGFIGIELYEYWFDIAKKRIESVENSRVSVELYCGDSYDVMKGFEDDSVDFIVTSPPYWGILDKIDRKARERVKNGLKTNYGTDERDLSNIKEYCDFLKVLQMHFREYYRILRFKKYVAIIVSDFRHKQRYYMFHADVGSLLESVGFVLQGLIVLIQDNKKLYPYGYPIAYVPNISNQFIVLARKV